MGVLSRIRALLNLFLHRTRVEAELHDDVEAFYETMVERYIGQGISEGEARRLARRALESAECDVAEQGYQLTRAALLVASGHPLPELARILTSHSLIHTADGEFFRKALLDASAARKLAVTTLKARQLLATASSELRQQPAALDLFVKNIGKPLGSPWSQDEKFAFLAAWLALRA